MKLRAIAAVAAVLFLTLSSVACGRSGDGKDFTDMMGMVPWESNCFSHWAVDELGTDPDLRDIYAMFKESPQAQQLMDVELALFPLEHSARASGFDGEVTILEGDLNSKDIERRLTENGYVRTEYRKTVIWTPPDGSEQDSLALKGEIILMGSGESLRSCIDTMSLEQAFSLYDDQYVRWLTARLPEGQMVSVYKASFTSGQAYADLIAFGESYKKENQDRLRLTAVYMFQDSDAADRAQGEIEDYLENQKFANIKVDTSENYISITALIYVTDFVENIAFHY